MASSNTPNTAVEAACASLVREYLSRKGLKGTLQKMDEECPRNEFSISNRQALMKKVQLQKIMKKNKEDPEPLKAMLEIMTKHFMEQKSNRPPEQLIICEESLDLKQSDTSFSPQVNQGLAKSFGKLKAETLVPKQEKQLHNDLIMDEDVEGETIIGSGRRGLMTLESTESPPQYATRTQHYRPVSSKQGRDTIFSNNDVLLKRHRNQLVKSTRTASPQLDQQKKGNTSQNGSTFSFPIFNNNEGTMNNDTSSKLPCLSDSESPSISPVIRTKSSNKEDQPVSFGDLLQKGEERAQLLKIKRQDLESRNGSSQAYKTETSSMMDEKSKSRQRKENGNVPIYNSTKIVDLECEEFESAEFEDLELMSTVLRAQKRLKVAKLQSSPIDLKTAIALKNIVLGSPTEQYNDEWLQQSYGFCDIPDIRYGIVQKKGGPCGVFAAVQACLLQQILFGEHALPDSKYKNPSCAERSKALATALSGIFWRAGNYTSAVVTIPSETTHLLCSSKFKQDNVTEKLSLFTFTVYDELVSFLFQSVSMFENDGSPGIILTIYSAILSRKCHHVRADFDVPEETTLIGSHGYSTQELVNLLLTGRAVSNVFNDIMQLDSGGIGQTVTLKGINGRSEIGFLSLFEHYQSCQVGTYYKTPKNPIWVVCSESHFSVLFSPRKDLLNDWKVERRFDVIYYDGLAGQEEEIKLTVSTVNLSYKPTESDDDLIPPLEHCIRTKWADAEIFWNGHEPIL